MATTLVNFFFETNQNNWGTLTSTNPENLRLLMGRDMKSQQHSVYEGVYIEFRNYIKEFWYGTADSDYLLDNDQLLNNNILASSNKSIVYVGSWTNSQYGTAQGNIKLFRIAKRNGNMYTSEACTDNQFGHLPFVVYPSAAKNIFCMAIAIKMTESTQDVSNQEYIKLTIASVNLDGGGEKTVNISIVSYPNNFISGNPGGSNYPRLQSVSNIYIKVLYTWFLDTPNNFVGGGSSGFNSISINSTITINNNLIYSLNGLNINSGSGFYKLDSTRYNLASSFTNDTGQFTTLYAYVGMYSGASGIPHY